MPTIKARIGGAWVPVGGGGAGADEVWIGTAAPTDTATELWYDTDEPNLYEPDTARWNSAWGVVGQASNTTGQTGIGQTATDVTGLTVTFTPVVGRRYRTTVSWRGLTSAGTFLNAYISDSLNTIYQQRLYSFGASSYFHAYVEVVETGWGPTPITRKARVNIGSGGAGTVDIQAGADYPAFITVEDVGPVSLASSPPAQPSSVWTNLTLLNSWTNFNGGWAQAAYRKVGDWVELRGLIANPNTQTISAVVPIANLPAGYWPTAGNVMFNLPSALTGINTPTPVRCDVQTGGSVVYQVAHTQSIGFASLDNIRFSVTP